MLKQRIREEEKTVEQKKKDWRRKSVQQRRGKRVSGEGLPLEVDNKRGRERDVSIKVKQYKHNIADGKRQSVQQENSERVTRQKRSFADGEKDRVFMGFNL